MKKLRNEHGVALVTALLLTLIALAIVMAILYIITWQTRLSGAHKRYKTAIEASHGGVELITKQIIPGVFQNVTGATTLAAQFPGFNLTLNGCLGYKLQHPTAEWGATCGPDAKPFDPLTKTDMTITLSGTQSNYNVYAKVVDTVPGNSDTSGFEMLDSGAAVAGMSSGVSPKHLPALYRIEVQGQKQINPQEKAELSVLYAY